MLVAKIQLTGLVIFSRSGVPRTLVHHFGRVKKFSWESFLGRKTEEALAELISSLRLHVFLQTLEQPECGLAAVVAESLWLSVTG